MFVWKKLKCHYNNTDSVSNRRRLICHGCKVNILPLIDAKNLNFARIHSHTFKFYHHNFSFPTFIKTDSKRHQIRYQSYLPSLRDEDAMLLSAFRNRWAKHAELHILTGMKSEEKKPQNPITAKSNLLDKRIINCNM